MIFDKDASIKKCLSYNTLHILFQCERLMGGMQKIAEASVQLNELNDKLAVQKVAVTEKTGENLSDLQNT